jgi:DNA-binding FadR family transcriptional regulator
VTISGRLQQPGVKVPIQVRTDSQEPIRRLIDFIKAKGLNPGDRLPSIRHLASVFGLGTNAVRDALVQAQAIGLVKVHPRSGAFVQSLNYAPFVDALADTVEASLLQADHNLLHLLDARRYLETELAAQAARHRRLEALLPVRQALATMRRCARQRAECVEADIQFHLGIARAAGNPVLVIILQALLGLQRPHLIAWPWTQEGWQRTDRSHAAIYQAILEQDIEEARKAMSEHLNLACEHLLKEIQATAVSDP